MDSPIIKKYYQHKPEFVLENEKKIRLSKKVDLCEQKVLNRYDKAVPADQIVKRNQKQKLPGPYPDIDRGVGHM